MGVNDFTLVPVKDFLPNCDLANDPEFRRLTWGLTPRSIEYAKARTVMSSNRAAVRHITRENLSDKQAKDLGDTITRGHQALEVQALIDYLKPLYEAHIESEAAKLHPSLTMNEVLLKWEALFRDTPDPVIAQNLGEKIIKYRNLHATDNDRTRDVVIPPDFIESLGREDALAD